MDLVRLAHYPFLPEVRDAVRELGPDVPTLLSSPRFLGTRERAVERIEAGLDGKAVPAVVLTDDRSALHELLSVPIARMLVVMLGDRFLARRYAEAESKRVEETLERDAAFLPVAAHALELPIQHGDTWRMHFADYVEMAPPGPGWKLIERAVSQGQVKLGEEDAVRLCGEALSQKIQDELEAERDRPLPGDLQKLLEPLAETLGPKVAEAREKYSEGDFGPVKKELFPPCIVHIFGEMKSGVMVSHHARFAVASFLATIGMTSDQIIDYFREIPNFDADKSRYQITHIAGEQSVGKYTPPGCATMQTHGICPLEKRDGLCFKIKHPLSYYRARLRFQKQDQQRASVAEASA